MNILLIQPPLNPHLIGAGVAYLTEPLALEVIAAAIPQEMIRILDMRLDKNLEQELMRFNPDIVGITGNTTDVYKIIDILKKVKQYNPAILTVVGGHHATMATDDFDKACIDVVVIGEGEETFRELVEAFSARRTFSSIAGLAYRTPEGFLYKNKARPCRTDLDCMPLPDRSLTAQYRHLYFRGAWQPLASLTTSKGCPFRCNFCALWKITGGTYSMRSPESVVNELAGLDEPFIDFAEDNVLHDVGRARKMCDVIKERGIHKTYKLYARTDTIVRHPDIIEKWKDIGMGLMLVGLESYRDNELKGLNKNNSVRNNEEAIRILQRNDVDIAAYFIVNPNYTEDDFKGLADYVAKMKLTQPHFTVLTPLPGTELYKERFHELTTKNYELFDFVHAVLPTTLPLEKFYDQFINLYRTCYQKSGGTGKERTKDSKLDAIISQIQATLYSSHEVNYGL